MGLSDDAYLKSGWGLMRRCGYVDVCRKQHGTLMIRVYGLDCDVNRCSGSLGLGLTMIWDSATLTYATDIAIKARKLQVAILEHDYCLNLSFEQGPRP